MNTPNPGSKEAVVMGCKCPIIDNHYGEGPYPNIQAQIFWIQADCPLHGSLDLRKGEKR